MNITQTLAAPALFFPPELVLPPVPPPTPERLAELRAEREREEAAASRYSVYPDQTGNRFARPRI